MELAKSNVSKKPISKEEYTTNKVLTVFSVCLLGVLVLMILQRLLDYGTTWNIGIWMTRALLCVGVLGVAWGLYLFSCEHAGKRSGARRIVCGRHVVIASVLLTLCMTVINYLGAQPIKALYVILPVLAVYYLVYHSYAPEFFLIAVDTGAAVALMWIAQRAAVSTNYLWMAYGAIAAAVVLTVIQLLCMRLVHGKKGKFTFCGKKIDAQFSRNAYTMLTVTPLLMTVLVAVAAFLPAYQLAAMGVAAAYLFVTAVYYTVKLM